MALYIDQLDKYADYKISIQQGGAGNGSISPIHGIITDESFGIGTQANLDAADAGDLDSFVKGAIKGAADMASSLLSSKVDKYFNSLRQSAVGWTNGSNISFPVSFNVYKSDSSGVGRVSSYKTFSANIFKLTQTRSKFDDSKQEPYYYDIVDYNKAVYSNKLNELESKLFTITIGTWFKAKYLIPTSVQLDYSTFVDSNGDPIYCRVVINFVSYRDLNGAETAKIMVR